MGTRATIEIKDDFGNTFYVYRGPMRSDFSHGNNGQFRITSLKLSRALLVQASDEDWEHVSVSVIDRCPTWFEMCLVKRLFWDDDDMVIQYHPPVADYVNDHPYVLHMWRKAGTNDFCERPPLWMV